MTGKFADTVRVSHDEALAIAQAWATPEALASLDALTDAEIAASIAADPGAAPELSDAWFEDARLVVPLRARKHAA